MNGHPEVTAAAKAAIDMYGTSPSASRLTAGERPVHRELEKGLAEVYGAEACVCMVSGHATNVTTIGHLVGAKDLVVYDSMAHNSILVGAKLSGAERRSFAHNDLSTLDALLSAMRDRYENVLIAVEGLYSMDGDYPDLPRLIEIKRRYGAWLMVDDAHALGVHRAARIWPGRAFRRRSASRSTSGWARCPRRCRLAAVTSRARRSSSTT